jgi:hypothetical protein
MFCINQQAMKQASKQASKNTQASPIPVSVKSSRIPCYNYYHGKLNQNSDYLSAQHNGQM